MPTLCTIPLFSALDDEAREALQQQTKRKRYQKRTIIIEKGDESSALYVLESGRAKVYVADDSGKEMLLRELGPGDHFGELAMLGELPRTASVMTLTDCEVRILTAAVFKQTMAEHPAIAVGLIREMAREVARLTETASDMALLSVYERIVKVLNECAEEDDGRRITMPLTQQRIAEQVGCSREMVSRIVGDLKTGGYISLEGKRFVIERKLPERW
jgi:CRP/FNR family cyclic AMP-dependent transcriptional regulator